MSFRVADADGLVDVDHASVAVDSDNTRLHELGYKQELNRDLS